MGRPGQADARRLISTAISAPGGADSRGLPRRLRPRTPGQRERHKRDSIASADRYNAAVPQPQRIAIVLPNWVGDVVMATPALRSLRMRFSPPAYRVTHVGRPLALATLSGGDFADEQMVDCSRRRPVWLNFLRQVRRVRRARFDQAVLLPNSFRSALLCRLGRVGRIAGYDRDGRGWMLSEKLQPPRDESGRFLPVPTIDYYNALARMLGAEAQSRRMTLGAEESDEAAAEALLEEAGIDQSRPIVVLNPGASFGSSKRWPAERYAAVADALIERRGAQIVLNAAPAERQVAAGVAEAMARTPAVNFARRPNTIGLLKSLLKRSSLLITNDTGARHVAAAMGIGVVTIFGSTDPTWARIDYAQERILRADVPCSPCQKKACPLKPGPTFHQCMTAITPEMVLAAAEELLDRHGREAPS